LFCIYSQHLFPPGYQETEEVLLFPEEIPRRDRVILSFFLKFRLRLAGREGFCGYGDEMLIPGEGRNTRPFCEKERRALNNRARQSYLGTSTFRPHL